MWCVVKLSLSLHSLSLSCSLSFLFSFPFFFSYLSSSLFFFFFSLAPSLTLALALVLSLSLLSSFFPSTHSSLLFPSRQQTLYKSTDQQTRRPTLRRLNVMWRTVRSQPHKKEEGTFYYRNISGDDLFFITVLNKFQKIAAGENYSHYSFILIQKQKGCNCNDFLKDGTCFCTSPRHLPGTHFSVDSSRAETHHKQSSVSRDWEKW